MNCTKYLDILNENDSINNEELERHISTCNECRESNRIYSKIKELIQISEEHSNKEKSLISIYRKIEAEAEAMNLLDGGWLIYYKQAFKYLLRPIHAMVLIFIFVFSTISTVYYVNYSIKERIVEQHKDELKVINNISHNIKFLERSVEKSGN